MSCRRVRLRPVVVCCVAATVAACSSGKVTPVRADPASLARHSQQALQRGQRTVTAHGLRVDVPASWAVVKSEGCDPGPRKLVVLGEGGAAGCGQRAPTGSYTRVQFFNSADASLPPGQARTTTTIAVDGFDVTRRTETTSYGYLMLVTVPDIAAAVLVTGSNSATVARIAHTVGIAN